MSVRPTQVTPTLSKDENRSIMIGSSFPLRLQASFHSTVSFSLTDYFGSYALGHTPSRGGATGGHSHCMKGSEEQRVAIITTSCRRRFHVSSSWSMQPGTILVVHGSTADVQHGITACRWHVQVMACSSVMLCRAPMVCVCVPLDFASLTQGTKGR